MPLRLRLRSRYSGEGVGGPESGVLRVRVRVSREAARHGEHALRLWLRLLNAAPKKEPQKEIGTSLKGEKT